MWAFWSFLTLVVWLFLHIFWRIHTYIHVLCWMYALEISYSDLCLPFSFLWGILMKSYSLWLVLSVSCLGNLCPHNSHEDRHLSCLWNLYCLIFNTLVYNSMKHCYVYDVKGDWFFSYLYPIALSPFIIFKDHFFPLHGSGTFVISQGALYTWVCLWILKFLPSTKSLSHTESKLVVIN